MTRAAFVLLIVSMFMADAAGQGPLAVSAGTVIPVEGAPVRNGVVLMESGKISAVGADLAVPKEIKVLSFPEGVVFPGLVDGACHLGAVSHRDEISAMALPGLRMADALDGEAPSITEARNAGITTFHLVPGDATVIGGRTAVVKVDPDGKVSWLRREAFLKCCIASSALRQDLPPTNALGALEIIENRRDDPAVKPFWAERSMVAAFTSREVDVASGLHEQLGMRPLLLANTSAVTHVSRLRTTTQGVILDPVWPSLEERWRRAPAALHAAKVPFGFGSRSPAQPAGALRLSAVTARRSGLSKEAAWAALTIGPARLLGVDARVGSLRKGKDADLIVFSHDPSDARARVLCVIQDGRVVFRSGEDEEESQR